LDGLEQVMDHHSGRADQHYPASFERDDGITSSGVGGRQGRLERLRKRTGSS
jgi:hypothetical protein